jgi:hypothetical protein
MGGELSFFENPSGFQSGHSPPHPVGEEYPTGHQGHELALPTPFGLE